MRCENRKPPLPSSISRCQSPAPLWELKRFWRATRVSSPPCGIELIQCVPASDPPGGQNSHVGPPAVNQAASELPVSPSVPLESRRFSRSVVFRRGEWHSGSSALSWSFPKEMPAGWAASPQPKSKKTTHFSVAADEVLRNHSVPTLINGRGHLSSLSELKLFWGGGEFIEKNGEINPKIQQWNEQNWSLQFMSSFKWNLQFDLHKI